ncbi:hypothetical protein BV22DRAFT_46868 [Leucogyrophana mollusca]|uniref:Uncharacterized protein n=1 Tax=Leucogyrophana mollusca TaxID=85980 RepID=A0ACB8BYD3_9AGAM|nr:hypothetical protein BV22DRAFT_46868 [Leucogyrophana mollusca]
MSNLTHLVVDAMIDHTIGVFSEPPGAIIIGGFIQWFLQGIIIIQAAQYYEWYPDDSRKLRLFVAFMVLLVLVQTGLESHKVWRVSINHQVLLREKIAPVHVFLNGFIGGVNKIYLIRRCWRVTNKSRWIIPLIPFALSTYATNILIAFTTSKFQGGIPDKSEPTAWYSRIYILDICVARARRYIDRALWGYFAIATESALWPSLCMVIAVGLFSSSNPSSNRLVLLFLLMTGKLYTISLLRTLNARAKLHARIKSHDLGRTSLRNWQWDHGAPDALSNLPMRSTSFITDPATQTNSVGASICPLETADSRHDPVSIPPRILQSPRTVHLGTVVTQERPSPRSVRSF